MSRHPDELNPGFQTQAAPPKLLARALTQAAPPGRATWTMALAAGVLVGATGAAAVLGGVPRPHLVGPPEAVELSSLPVRFVLHAPEAREVRVAGSWNGWDSAAEALHAGPDGVFFATVTLPPGQYEYQFVVDGAWRADPAAPLSRDDGFGRRNSVLSL